MCILWLKNTFSAKCNYTLKRTKSRTKIGYNLKYKTSRIEHGEEKTSNVLKNYRPDGLRDQE